MTDQPKPNLRLPYRTVVHGLMNSRSLSGKWAAGETWCGRRETFTAKESTSDPVTCKSCAKAKASWDRYEEEQRKLSGGEP